MRLLYRRFVAYVLLLVFLCGTFGISVYELHCACEKLHDISFVSQKHHCKTKDALPSCCKRLAKASHKTIITSPDCCDYVYKYLKIQDEYRTTAKLTGSVSSKISFLPYTDFVAQPFGLPRLLHTAASHTYRSADKRPPIPLLPLYGFYGAGLRVRLRSLRC